MARGSAADIRVRQRLGDALPSMYLDDEFVQRFCDGLDVVIAPVPSVLDSFAALLDPHLTPADFLLWLGSWVGATPATNLPLERRRMLVARTAALHRRRGTVRGLAEVVELHTGIRPQVMEGGGVTTSTTPTGVLPGRTTGEVVVRVPAPRPSDREVRRLEEVVAAHIPAHLAHRLEFATPPPPAGASAGSPSGELPA